MGSNFKVIFVMFAMILTIFCLNSSDIAIDTVKGFDYFCIIYDISKFEAIHLLKNSILEDFGYI